MASKRRSKAISAGMKRYHRNASKKKSNAGTRKAARTRWKRKNK